MGTTSSAQLMGPTRNAAELRSALEPDSERALGKHCERIVGSLGPEESVHAIASCVSGKPGLLAISDERLLFVFKPDAITPARVVSKRLRDLSWAQSVGEDALQTQDAKLVAYRQIRPAIAPRLAQLMWDLGAPHPEGYAEPENGSSLLPSASPETLLQTLHEQDRAASIRLVERACDALDEGEEVHLVAVATSAADGLLALTDRRVLWAAGESGSVTLVGIPIKLILRASADHGAVLVLGIHSINLPEFALREMRPALGEAFVSGIRERGGADSSIAEKAAASGRVDQSALSVLPGKTARLVRSSIGPDEPVFVVLVGGFGQALIALADRIIIAKAGLMSGNTFGGKVTAFPYREVTGIEIHTGFATGVLAIQTASFPGTQAGSYWSKGKKVNPAELPNAIPLPNKGVLGAWQKHLQTLRNAVAAGGLTAQVTHPAELGPPVMLNTIPKKAPPASPPPSPDVTAPAVDLGAQLKQLAELHDAGALTDEEFAHAKAKLLS